MMMEQHGFSRKHSCRTNWISILHEVKGRIDSVNLMLLDQKVKALGVEARVNNGM